MIYGQWSCSPEIVENYNNKKNVSKQTFLEKVVVIWFIELEKSRVFGGKRVYLWILFSVVFSIFSSFLQGYK